MANKNSNQEAIDKALTQGGIIYVENVRIFIDNPEDYDTVSSPTGYWITSAGGFKVYFKGCTRQAAQKACHTLFGKGRYTVNTKV